MEWLIKKIWKRTSRQFQLLLARDLLLEIQQSTDYSISDTVAEEIIIAVVKSSGNKVHSFIVKED